MCVRQQPRQRAIPTWDVVLLRTWPQFTPPPRASCTCLGRWVPVSACCARRPAAGQAVRQAATQTAQAVRVMAGCAPWRRPRSLMCCWGPQRGGGSASPGRRRPWPAGPPAGAAAARRARGATAACARSGQHNAAAGRQYAKASTSAAIVLTAAAAPSHALGGSCDGRPHCDVWARAAPWCCAAYLCCSVAVTLTRDGCSLMRACTPRWMMSAKPVRRRRRGVREVAQPPLPPLRRLVREHTDCVPAG